MFFLYLIIEDIGIGGPLSFSSWTFTTWGTVFKVDSVNEALTAAEEEEEKKQELK